MSHRVHIEEELGDVVIVDHGLTELLGALISDYVMSQIERPELEIVHEEVVKGLNSLGVQPIVRQIDFDKFGAFLVIKEAFDNILNALFISKIVLNEVQALQSLVLSQANTHVGHSRTLQPAGVQLE